MISILNISLITNIGKHKRPKCYVHLCLHSGGTDPKNASFEFRGQKKHGRFDHELVNQVILRTKT